MESKPLEFDECFGAWLVQLLNSVVKIFAGFCFDLY